jgi:uncharacterized protein (TIGR02001 family)
MFKKTVIAGLTAAALGAGLAPAQAADAPPPDHTFTGNVGLYSQYIFRGLTQTNREPAIQGGFDYGHSSGFYAGTWASNISWLRDGGSYMAGGSGEFDFYGGYKGTLGKSDFSYDLGALYYWYPGDVAPGFVKANTLELYAGLGWKWLTGKFSYAVSDNVFGFADADGSYYLDLSATVPIAKTGINFVAHWGMQEFRGGTTFNNDLCSYKDWKLGLTYALPKDFTIGAFYTDTSNASGVCYGTPAEGGVFPRNIARSTGTVFISKTF